VQSWNYEGKFLVRLYLQLDPQIPLVKKKPVKNQRIIVFFIFIGLFTASYYIGSLSEISEEDALLFMEEFEELIEDIDGLGIFLHNSMIGLVMFIPGVGVGWGLFSAFQTGQAFAAIALIEPLIADINCTLISI